MPQIPKPKDIPNCAEAGVLGVLPGVIGTMQATEAIKIILGKGDILSGKLLLYDALDANFEKLNLTKNKDCKLCGNSPTIKELEDYEGNNQNNSSNELIVRELNELIETKEDFALIDVREKEEQDLGTIENAKLVSFNEIYAGNLESLNDLDKNKKTILFCHTGQRSAYVAQLLKDKGFRDVENLVGGIVAWQEELDETVD